ncbi:SGNH/GDSL hydrolase family protein [bacterium]|nr:SGNH/GDSL hydrolase family protein [bacterium]
MLDRLLGAAVNAGILLAAAGALGLAGMWLRRRLTGSRWRPLVDAVVVGAAALGLAGTVVEVAAVVYDVPVRLAPWQYVEYRPGRFGQQPNQHWTAPPLPRWPGYEVRTNEDGLRSDRPRLPDALAPDERRVMFFGDSFTFGVGLEAAQSYPAQAETLLQAAAPRYRWIALNAGMGGTNIFTAVEWFAWLAPRYHPRVAVFTVHELDDILPDVNSELRRHERDPLRPLARFALYRLVRRAWQTVRYVRMRDHGRRIAAGELPAERAMLLAEITASAALMAETARGAGCAVVFNRIRVRAPDWRPASAAQSLLHPYVAAGAELVDTIWNPDDPSLSIPDDSHPTPAGALLLARAVVPAILAAAEGRSPSGGRAER